MKEDLIQYITNALYRAHDYDTQTMKPIEFDKWVEEQIKMLGLYFDSMVIKNNWTGDEHGWEVPIYPNTIVTYEPIQLVSHCPECGYANGHIRGCQLAVREITDEDIDELENNDIHDYIVGVKRSGEIE